MHRKKRMKDEKEEDGDGRTRSAPREAANRESSGSAVECLPQIELFTMSSVPLSCQVRALYRTFLHYGKDWPGTGGSVEFKRRLRLAFQRNANLTNPEEIEKAIQRGYFVIKEIDALYKLKKYRTIKRRYYSD